MDVSVSDRFTVCGCKCGCVCMRACLHFQWCELCERWWACFVRSIPRCCRFISSGWLAGRASKCYASKNINAVGLGSRLDFFASITRNVMSGLSGLPKHSAIKRATSWWCIPSTLLPSTSSISWPTSRPPASKAAPCSCKASNGTR